MTDFLNLDSRTSKLQKEQQKRRDQARLRIQKEKKTKELAARDRAKVEEQIKARKLEQQRKEEEVCSRYYCSTLNLTHGQATQANYCHYLYDIAIVYQVRTTVVNCSSNSSV